MTPPTAGQQRNCQPGKLMTTKSGKGRSRWAIWLSKSGLCRRGEHRGADEVNAAELAAPADPSPPLPADAPDMPSLVQSILAQQRYALLLRRQVAEGLSHEQYAQAHELLERAMAVIPAGIVDLDPRGPDEADAPADTLRQVASLLLDRYPVTNRQFRQFVEAGGYKLPALWSAEAWPAVSEFVDATGAAGPRYWRSGQYANGHDDHPVVGVSWHEAAAYARWTGKRLPGDAEWVKAAAWPIALADGQQRQRRFPWGETMDRGRCNLWGWGPGRTTAVSQFSTGVNVGGVYQLIGNVWEWTGGDFEAVDQGGAPLELPTPMKSIRGGAFDTYFEQQATCQFRRGENPFARKHNIGFRCALSVCDVARPPAVAGRWRTQSTGDSPTHMGVS